MGITTLAELKAQLKPGQMSMLHSRESLGLLGEGGFESGLTWYACLAWLSHQWYCGTGVRTRPLFKGFLGAKSMQAAQMGPIFAGFLKILPVFILVFPGVIAYVLFQRYHREQMPTRPYQC